MTSGAHLRAMVHLASLNATMGSHGRALAVLRDAEKLLCAAGSADSLKLLPVLHATADAQEAAGRLELSLEALERAKDIVRLRQPDNTMRIAHECFTCARATVRHANGALMMTPEQRGALVNRAVELAFEGSEAADAAFDSRTAACSARTACSQTLKMLRRGHTRLCCTCIRPRCGCNGDCVHTRSFASRFARRRGRRVRGGHP